MSARSVEAHLGLVHHIARKVRVRRGTILDFDDLVSAGVIGLMQAIESFDESRGYKFSTFAAARIRGAILDELRNVDTLPRTARGRMRRLKSTQDALTQRLGRTPDDGEIAESLGIDRPTLARWRERFNLPSPRVWIVRDPEEAPLEVVDDETERRVELAEQLDRVRAVFPSLNPQERMTIILYYRDGLTLLEIGKKVGLTEARVSQVRKSALRKLRTRLRDR